MSSTNLFIDWGYLIDDKVSVLVMSIKPDGKTISVDYLRIYNDILDPEAFVTKVKEQFQPDFFQEHELDTKQKRIAKFRLAQL